MRKLATIQKVLDVEKHPNADRLDICIIKGWEVITVRDQFKVGDLCVFFEIDSLLYSHPVFDFLSKYKYRVKTQKLRGTISQGLAMPVSIIGEITNNHIYEIILGQDVTEILKVTKHDPQAKKEARRNQRKDPKRNFIVEYMLSFAWFRKFYFTFISQKRVRNFPWFISKTDEERIQNMPRIFRHWDGKQAYVMEKLDGTSATYAIFKDNKWYNKLVKKNFYVCSRNLTLHRENDTEWWKMARTYDIKNKLLKVGKNIAIQGEIIGPGIQKNKYKLDNQEYHVFNVIDIDENYKYSLGERKAFCKEYGFNCLDDFLTIEITEDLDVKYMVEMSKGDSAYQNWDRIKNLQREGIVVRLLEDDRHSFKVVNPDFLLKYDE